MNADPLTIVIVIAAVAFGAFAKSIIGLGMPIVAVPAIALMVGMEQAVLVMALPTFVTNVWLLVVHRRHLHGLGHLKPLVVTAGVGSAVGTFVLTRVDPRWPKVILGVLIGVYLLVRIGRPHLRIPQRLGTAMSPAVGLVGGVLQGATGVSAPVLVPYLDGLRLSREAFIVTLGCVFQSITLVQMVAFTSLGRYTTTNVVLSACALVPALASFPLGIRLGRRLDRVWFERLVLLLLAFMGVNLLVDALGGRW